jgi:outer membrane lipoprotein-sorting protein
VGSAVGLPASAEDGLAPKSAEELLVELQLREPVPLSGTVAASADLGLPALPRGRHRGADMADLVSADSTLRVWSDGPQRSRVSLLAPSAQADVVRNGSVVWTWNSADNAADRYELPDRSGWPTPKKAPDPADLPSTPQEAAEMALAAVDPTTEVTTSGVARVAGRPAYELVLAPKGDDTRVAQVAIAVDAETGTSLRVRVYSTQIADPAFEVGFSTVDFSAPDPAMFEFTPPDGAEVTRHPAPDPGDLRRARDTAEGEAAKAQWPEPTIVGEGWSTVVVTDLGDDPLGDAVQQDSGSAGSALALLEALPATSGPWGSGRVLDGTLFSAIVTDDGRLAVGAVAPEALGAALAER